MQVKTGFLNKVIWVWNNMEWVNYIRSFILLLLTLMVSHWRFLNLCTNAHTYKSSTVWSHHTLCFRTSVMKVWLYNELIHQQNRGACEPCISLCLSAIWVPLLCVSIIVLYSLWEAWQEITEFWDSSGEQHCHLTKDELYLSPLSNYHLALFHSVCTESRVQNRAWVASHLL